MVGFADNVGLVSLLILQKKANRFVLTNMAILNLLREFQNWFTIVM